MARLSVNCFLKTHIELVEDMVLYMYCVRIFSLTYLRHTSSYAWASRMGVCGA